MAKKALIAYYSWGGNTRKLAEAIQGAVGSELFEIIPETPYVADYNKVVAQAKEEIRQGYRPPLQAEASLEDYDTLFIGTPNWWSSVAPPVATFLSAASLSGKTVIPFYTHGGGGGGHIEKDIAALCPGAVLKKGYGVYEKEGGAGLEAWLSEIDEK